MPYLRPERPHMEQYGALIPKRFTPMLPTTNRRERIDNSPTVLTPFHLHSQTILPLSARIDYAWGVFTDKTEGYTTYEKESAFEYLGGSHDKNFKVTNVGDSTGMSS